MNKKREMLMSIVLINNINMDSMRIYPDCFDKLMLD